MRKILFAAVVAAGAVFAGSASAAPTPAQTPAGFDQAQGQVEQIRHGGRGMHRGWGHRHYGWRRGHHYGWRHHRRWRHRHW
ncbi:MAG: hypothetical protein U1E30_12090 [Rhodoblastus sp.]